MDRADLCSAFIDSLTFDLYSFQEEALLAWFEAQGGVLVCAPTGMGKTLLAEAAAFEALHTRKRAYITTPLIALTEQKFRELQGLAEKWGFAREDVGLITGNRRENPDACVRVVVAEILLNHLLARDDSLGDFENVSAVVMDEFHSFNDPERGIVWELALVLLPLHVRVLLLSATVGNPYEFADWLRDEHGRRLTIVTTAERRVPLEFVWVEDRLLTELLPDLATDADESNRTPALVFCFNRDECWELAERLKGLSLINSGKREQIEAYLADRAADLADGVGPKLRQMLIRGVGVHHAGVLPKHKAIVEHLFTRKLVPFVICTETLAAGINLPARSVVLSTLLKGPRGEKKLVASSTAHQMFGRAGRPQFDTRGYVYAVAHEDDVKINKWKKKYEQLDPNSKDPGILRARKDLERKRPTRRKTEQYWAEGQFRTLIASGPARLASRSMIPYSVLVFLLTRDGSLAQVKRFLATRFAPPALIETFETQLEHMVGNMAGLGYLLRSDDGDHITLDPGIFRLLGFRSIDPLYADFLSQRLSRANLEEKTLALESVLELPRAIERKIRIPDRAPGPLESQELIPELTAMGVAVAGGGGAGGPDEQAGDEDDWLAEDDPEQRPPTFPEMLKLLFEAKLPNPEPVRVQPKCVAGLAADFDCDFFKLVKSLELIKQEGLILRHLLRLAILSGEFFLFTEDPEYQQLGELATRTCHRVDPSYTDRFLADAAQVRSLPPLP